MMAAISSARISSLLCDKFSHQMIADLLFCFTKSNYAILTIAEISSLLQALAWEY
jgi:hypothetical protein